TAAAGAAAGTTFAGGHGGVAEGGSIYTDSNNLHLSDCSFTSEEAAGGAGGNGGASGKGGAAGEARGGVLFNEGITTLDHVSIDTASAIGGDAGKIFTAVAPAGRARGGAIYNLTTLHLSNVSFTKARAVGGHADNDVSGGDAQGGAIANVNAGTFDLSLCTFDQCSANAGSSLMAHGGEARGGAIYSENNLTIDTTDIGSSSANGGDSGVGNTTTGVFGSNALGAGLFLLGTTATITNSSIHGNVAHGGKGSNATGGVGGQGGFASGAGIYDGVTLTLNNSTVYANQAIGGTGGNGTGGGDGGNAVGAGISMDNTTLNATNVTIANNGCQSGTPGSGGGGLPGSTFGGGIDVSDIATLTNTIIADNNAGGGPDILGNPTLVHCLVSTPATDYTP